MKVNEVLDAGVLAHRLDVLNKNKPESTKTLIKLLRARADKRNPKPETRKPGKKSGWFDDPFGGMSGYAKVSKVVSSRFN